MRIYSNYTDSEKNAITAEASSIGMTPSSFQKYCTMLYVNRDPNSRSNVLSIPSLIKEMMTALSNLDKGTTFICSSLFAPEIWSNLSPSEKRTLAFKLRHEVDNSSEYQIIGNKRGKINQYKKI